METGENTRRAMEVITRDKQGGKGSLRFLSYSREPDEMVFTVSLPLRSKPVSKKES